MMAGKQVFIAGIRGYQRYISPFLPRVCRFYPSCSEYAIQAIAYHGTLRGVFKAVWRLLRCHPLSHGGVDLPHDDAW
jgi:putative membrane protein insertion efficiency factor